MMKLRVLLLVIVVGFLAGQGSSAQEKESSTAAKASAPAAENGSAVKVVKAVLCHDVKDREAQEEVTAANVGDVVVGWMKVQSPEDTTLTHRWILDDETISDVQLQIKSSSSYRTWSRKTIGSAGNWKWQILDAEGNVLREVTFSAASSAD
jgi:hypothetical protein